MPFASEKARLDVVQRLLADPRVDPAVADSLLLRTAAVVSHMELVQLLLVDRRVQPAKQKATIIGAALQSGDMLQLERLLTDPFVGWEVKADGHSTLVAAAEYGSRAAVERLLAIEGIDVDGSEQGEHASMCAASKAAFKEHWGIVQLLLSHPRFRASRSVDWLLCQAAHAGRSAVVFRLLQLHPTVNLRQRHSYNSQDPLKAAAVGGHIDMLCWLLALPADQLPSPDDLGKLVVHAASAVQLSAFEFLLLHPRVNAAPHSSEALARLLLHADSDKVAEVDVIAQRLLAFSGIDPTAMDNMPIRGASQLGLLNIMEWLLADARVDPTVHGNQALYLATKHGHCAAVSRLLADPRVSPADTDDDIIYDAVEKGHVAAARTLLADSRVDKVVGLSSIAAGHARRGDADGLFALIDELEEAGALSRAAHRAVIVASAAHHWELLSRALQDDRLRAVITPAAWGDALVVAASNNAVFPLQILLAAPIGDHAQVAAGVHRALYAAAEGSAYYGRHVEIVERLLQRSEIDVPYSGDSALLAAARSSDSSTQVAKLLLADPRISRCGALSAAAGRGIQKLKLLQLLLADEQVDPSTEGSAALAVAALQGGMEEDGMRLLLADPRTDPGPRCGELLWYTVDRGFPPMATLRALLDDPRVDATATLHSGPWPLVGSNESAGSAAVALEDAIYYYYRQIGDAERRAALEAQDAEEVALCHGDPLLLALRCNPDGSNPERYEVALKFDASKPVEEWPLHIQVSRLFLSCSAVLNARMRQAGAEAQAQPLWLDVMRRIGTSVEGLCSRAWRRRCRVIAARERCLEAEDEGR